MGVEPRVARAPQPHHRVPDRLAHPPHLAVAALVEHELHPRAAELTGAGRSRDAVLELDAVRERRHGGGRQVSLDVGDVGLLDAVARMRQPVGEVAVVREQQHAARVDVEPSHRHDAGVVPDEVDDRRAALRVARRRDDAERLVEQDVRELLLADAVAVDLDDVPGGDEGVELTALTVDRDPARLDQLVCGAAGGDAGAREVAVEAHRGHCRYSPARCATTPT